MSNRLKLSKAATKSLQERLKKCLFKYVQLSNKHLKSAMEKTPDDKEVTSIANSEFKKKTIYRYISSMFYYIPRAD